MSWRHRDILEAELHEPKGFTTANNGDSIWRNEQGLSEWTDREVLPAALNFVDASVAPPTTASGDIYVLSLGASIHANWGTVALKDWVRYNGVSWNVITPSKSILCYDKTEDVLMSYDGSVWATVGSDTNLATTNLTQTDQNRRYTLHSTNPSKLTFEGVNGNFHLQDDMPFKIFTGSDSVASNLRFELASSSNGGAIGFNNNRSNISSVSDDLIIKSNVQTGLTSKIELGASLLINTHSTRALQLQSNFIFLQSSSGTSYGTMKGGSFIWGAVNLIGSEGISLQKDTLVKGSNTSASTTGFKVTNSTNASLLEVKNNGVINASNLPTSSAGLSSGDIWNNSGVLNIV